MLFQKRKNTNRYDLHRFPPAISKMKPYYADNLVTLFHGDCRELLPSLQGVDLVLTDPPYGLAEAETNKNNYVSFSDKPDEVTLLVTEVVNRYRGKRLVMTPGQSQMFAYPEPDAIGAFYYPAGTGSCSWGFVGWQPIFYYGKDPYLTSGKGRRSNSYSTTEQAEKNGHPCPKPFLAWCWLLQRTSLDGELVLDPFAGSGTTLRAARELGRHAIGIEIEEKYCEIAARRLEVVQPALFTAPTKERQEQASCFQ